MYIHYFKLALRNLRKYTNQTLISVVGLAVGFTCFALATLWIVYEMTYDSFHKNAKQLYVVYRSAPDEPAGFSRRTHNPLAAYLKATFPEIADATPLRPASRIDKVKVEDEEYLAMYISVDSAFFRMFDVKILDGSREFMIPDSRKLAITSGKARQLFGDEYPIGKTVNGSEVICAIVSDMSNHSNYAFDFIRPFGNYITNTSQNWMTSWGENTVIELYAGTDVEAFKKKLYEHEITLGRNYNNLTVQPVTKIRYTDPNVPRDVKFWHIFIFALSGLLVILCSLFNYLTLFVSRFRLRQKELALRMVCGASGGSLLSMLTVEFLLTLLSAVVLGCTFTEMVREPFLQLSGIRMGLPAIYRESFLYIGGIILVSLLMFWLLLLIFRHRSLNLSIRRSNTKLFRSISVVVQLVISIGFAFCTIIILKQLYFLHHTDELGFSFQNRGSISIMQEGYSDVLANHLKQIPEITETVDAKGITSLIPQNVSIGIGTTDWDDKPSDSENFSLDLMFVSPEYTSFYEFRLLAGEMLTEADPDTLVMLNETALKKFGWHNPVGKQFEGKYTVKGVIKNIHNLAPTVPDKAVCYAKYPQNRQTWGASYSIGETILFKYRAGTWDTCKEKIEQLVNKDYVDLGGRITIYKAEEEYDKFLKMENILIKLLSFISAICVLICVFGFVSMVSLTCEERRKSIAIRKITGATSTDILAIFAKEYALLLAIGAAIAFPAGFFIMQRWLEQYVKQTSIAAWLYLSILFTLSLMIVLCVGWRVYKSSIENPAETIKSE